MKVIFAIGLAVLLASCESGYGKAAPRNKDLCPAGPIPDGCPFPDHELSTFFPHANDCHWFFHCSNGVPYCKVCPADLHWNQALETCDYPENAGCSASGNPTTKIPDPETTASPETPKPTTAAPETPTPTTAKPTPPRTTVAPYNDCPAGTAPACPIPDPDFSVFFPHEKDCHWFYHCSNGVAYCKVCPDGLHWNPKLDTCDWPENAGCGSGSTPNTTNKPDPTTTVKPNTTTTAGAETTDKPASTTADPSDICPAGAEPKCPVPDPDFSVFFPHENNCHWFYHCSNGVAYCKICPPGLHWNPSLDTCDWPENAGCSGSSPSTTTAKTVAPTSLPTDAPTTLPTEAPTTLPTEAPTTLPTEAPTTLPTEAPTTLPTEAPTTLPTEAPTTLPTEAPTTLPTEAPTTLPTEAPTTLPTEAPTTLPTEAPTTLPTEGPTTLDPSDISPTGAVPTCPVPDPDFSVFFPHENACHWFYHCSNGVAYCKACPVGLHWNPRLNTCDWPENAGCGSGSVPTTTKKPDAPTTAKTTPIVITTTKKPDTPSPSTAIPTSTSDPSGDCPAGVVPTCPFPDPEFSVFFPHENDCHWFYHCSNGVAYCKVCPADLHWNPDKDTCDYAYRAGCSSSSYKNYN